ncbi:CMT1A duplicated region transcript 4 protein [Perognathus longimembris pacificus]|uniref:CMT1A duplicated region transcript 4 protein n=1 Tax=Perognathus longimembris pacificus TaxID=214514 RepID=UPI00201A0A58|nr:CMT1A duplicated region transcript 4 protein [Perognathus longimembris pacificus]
MSDKIDARKLKKEGLTENIGLPLKLLEKHDPWPAYVTYTSPIVKKLIEKSKIREMEYARILEESRQLAKSNKSSSSGPLKREKLSEPSVEMTLRDALSETMMTIWGAFPLSAMGSTIASEPVNLQVESRENPSIKYNKIIFTQKPLTRKLPYNSLQASKEKHDKV